MESRYYNIIVHNIIVIIYSVMLSNSIERPNHRLSYSVGNDFCLEDVNSLLLNITLECSLANEPDLLPEFDFIVERTLLNSSRLSMETLQMQTSSDSILKLNKTALLSLFIANTKFITIECVVDNVFGVATNITVCGMYYIIQYGPGISISYQALNVTHHINHLLLRMVGILSLFC